MGRGAGRPGAPPTELSARVPKTPRDTFPGEPRSSSCRHQPRPCSVPSSPGGLRALQLPPQPGSQLSSLSLTSTDEMDVARTLPRAEPASQARPPAQSPLAWPEPQPGLGVGPEVAVSSGAWLWWPRTALPSPPHSHGSTDLEVIYRPERHRSHCVRLLWQRGVRRAPRFQGPVEAVRGSPQQEPWVTVAVRGMETTGLCWGGTGM